MFVVFHSKRPRGSFFSFFSFTTYYSTVVMSIIIGFIRGLLSFFAAKAVRQIVIEGSYSVPFDQKQRPLAELFSKSSGKKVWIKPYQDLSKQDKENPVSLSDFLYFFQRETGSGNLSKFSGEHFICLESKEMNNRAPGTGAHKDSCYLGLRYLHNGGQPTMYKHAILFVSKNWIFGQKETCWKASTSFVLVYV